MLAAGQSITQWTDRVRAEYLEMPGLCLTRLQICRMWRLDASLCDAIVDALVKADFLSLRPNNTYGRVTNDV